MPRFNYGPRVRADVEADPAPPQAQPSGVGELGQGIAQAGQVLTGLAEKANEQEARGQATGALAALQERLNSRVLNAKQTLGEGALGLNATVPKVLDEDTAEIRKSIQNGLARELFDSKTPSMLGNARGSIEQHVLLQAHVVRVANVHARVEAAKAAIALDPGSADAHIAEVEADVRSQAVSKEDADAAAAAMKREFRVEQVNTLLAADSPEAAAAVYLQHEQDFGTGAPKVLALIQNAGRAKVAQASADAIFAGAYDPVTGRVQKGLVTKGLQSIDDGKTRQMAEQFVRVAEANAKEEWAQGVDDLHDHLLRKWQDTHNYRAVTTDAAVTELQRRDPDAWQRILDRMNSDVDRWDLKRRQRDAAKADDSDLYLEVRTKMAEDPTYFRGMNDRRFKREAFLDSMSDKHREKVMDLFAKIHGTKDTLDPDSFGLIISEAKDLVGAKGTNWKGWEPGQAAVVLRVQENVEKEIDRWAGKNLKMSPEKEREFIREQFQREDSFWGHGRARVEAELEGDLAGFEPPQLHDDAEREKARGALEAGGIPATEDAIDTAIRRRYGLPAAPQQAAPVAEPQPPAAPAPEAAAEEPAAENEMADPLGLKRFLAPKPQPADYYSAENVAKRDNAAADAAAEARRQALAAGTPRNRRQAIAKLDAMGVTGAERDSLLASWGYGGAAPAPEGIAIGDGP